MKDTVKSAKLDYKSMLASNPQFIKNSQSVLLTQILKFTPEWGSLKLEVVKI